MNNAVENVVEVGLDATTQQSVNIAAASMNEFTPLTNDESSETDYVAFWSCWNLELFLDNYFCCYFGGCQCWFGWCVSYFCKSNWEHNRQHSGQLYANIFLVKWCITKWT